MPGRGRPAKKKADTGSAEVTKKPAKRGASKTEAKEEGSNIVEETEQPVKKAKKTADKTGAGVAKITIEHCKS